MEIGPNLSTVLLRGTGVICALGLGVAWLVFIYKINYQQQKPTKLQIRVKSDKK